LTYAKPNYGIDAPGLVRFFFIGGILAATGFVIAALLLSHGYLAGRITIYGLAIVGFYLTGMGCLMLYWSRIRKITECRALLELIDWRGDEQVLDVGCGRGLLLIHSAQKLTTGKATGIDIWSAKDQSDNSPKGALENAQLIGVSDKIEIMTSDMRDMPFANDAMDVVMSHWVVHNLDSKADRDLSLTEMARVLKPGGTVLLVDIENREAYVETLKGLGFQDIRIIVSKGRDIFLGAVSFGSFRPAAILARKP
jgi:arsenite methyltransferase